MLAVWLPGPCGSGLFFDLMPLDQSAAKPAVNKRCVALIDGFNLFHAIDDVPHFHEYKWLNPQALARAFIMPSKESLCATFFFTAIPTWDDQKRTRHQRLMQVYEDIGVLVKLGMFKPTTKNCRVCGRDYDTFEEKQTDINICLELLRMGHDDIADKVILITGDNDQAASVIRFRELFQKKEIMVVTPPFRQAMELEQAAGTRRIMNSSHLTKSTLPNPYIFKNGKTFMTKPEHWVNAPMPANPGWQPRGQWVHKCNWD